MKYLSAEKNILGIKGVPQDFANLIMEGLGAKVVGEATVPALYENNGKVFGLEETVFEHDDFMFVKLSELSDESFSQVQESNSSLTETVNFNDVDYGLSEDIFEIEGEYYFGLTEDVEAEEEDDSILTVEGTDYLVVDNSDDADFIAYLAEGDEGEFAIVDEEDEHEYALYVKEL